jgi:hypothetical protein
MPDLPAPDVPVPDLPARDLDAGCSALSTKANKSLISVPVYKNNSLLLDYKSGQIGRAC